MRFLADLTQEQPLDFSRRLIGSLTRLGMQAQPDLFALVKSLSPEQVALVANLIKGFNKQNPLLKVSFAFDALNDQFDVKSSYPFWAKENMMRGFMLSREQAANIYHLLRSVVCASVEGDVVECGCYEGSTSVVLRKTLDELGSDKVLHVYDSFQGLPAPGPEDQGGVRMAAGTLATTEEALIATFRRFDAALPEIHKGWFEDTLETSLPDRIAFAHIDCDVYGPAKTCLAHIYPRLPKGAVVVMDDYADPELLPVRWNLFPGIKRACDEFFADKPEKVQPLPAGAECHGFFMKA